MKEFNIFKIDYSWYEGEYGETFLGKEVDEEDFEKDLIKAKEFAQNLVGKRKGKGYNSVDCLPNYYGDVIEFLIDKKRYIKCSFNNKINYSIDDERGGRDIILIKSKIKKIESFLAKK